MKEKFFNFLWDWLFPDAAKAFLAYKETEQLQDAENKQLPE